MPDQIQRFRFRPRFKSLAWGVVALGLIMLGVGLLVARSSSVPVGLGAAGVALGLLYLGSPAWRISVLADDQALEVRSGQTLKFRLPWDDVVEVVASPSTRTCFVDGGQPASSLLVPGPGASAPYDIEHKIALYELICARVPGERIRTVTSLDQATPRASAESAANETDTANETSTESEASTASTASTVNLASADTQEPARPAKDADA